MDFSEPTNSTSSEISASAQFKRASEKSFAFINVNPQYLVNSVQFSWRHQIGLSLSCLTHYENVFDDTSQKIKQIYTKIQWTNDQYSRNSMKEITLKKTITGSNGNTTGNFFILMEKLVFKMLHNLKNTIFCRKTWNGVQDNVRQREIFPPNWQTVL